MGKVLGRLNQIASRVEFFCQREKLISKPVDVDVVLTKACNFACTFCKDYETIGSKRISVENFERAARQLFPTARTLNICSGGEPYLHKGLEELLRIAKRYDLKTWVLSNGSILREDRVHTIVREQLIDRHGFSVDGLTAETVESIRINAKLDVILDNIRMLLRIRNNENKRYPRTTIRYAAMKSNIEELPDAVDQWGRMGIDTIDCSYLSLANDVDPQQCLYYHQDLTKRVFKEAKKVAGKYSTLTLNLPPLVEEDVNKLDNPVRCRAPWGFVYIDTNGQVLPCYAAFEALRFPSIYGDRGANFEPIYSQLRL